MVWRVWGKGEPLLLFHGGSGSWTHWLRNIPELARHYQLWVPDLPGLGQSAMPPEPLVPATSADVIVAGLDQLLPGARNLRLAGFSFGGHVAGLTAARLRDRIGVLTLIGVAARGLRAEPRERFAKQRPGMPSTNPGARSSIWKSATSRSVISAGVCGERWAPISACAFAMTDVGQKPTG